MTTAYLNQRADAFKKQVARLKSLQGPDYRWTHNLKEVSILHVDKSFKQPVKGTKRKTLQYKWLKIVADRVYDLGDFYPDSNEAIDHFLETSVKGTKENTMEPTCSNGSKPQITR